MDVLITFTVIFAIPAMAIGLYSVGKWLVLTLRETNR